MKSDLVFFPDEAARQAAVTAQRTEEYIADALAVGEFKGGGPRFDDQNPNFQIDYYPMPKTLIAICLVAPYRIYSKLQHAMEKLPLSLMPLCLDYKK